MIYLGNKMSPAQLINKPFTLLFQYLVLKGKLDPEACAHSNINVLSNSAANARSRWS